MDAHAGFAGALRSQLIKAPKGRGAFTVKTPFGRLLLTRDKGEGFTVAREQFLTNLSALHRDGDGKLIHAYDLGSGVVTDVGVLAMAYDATWPAPSGAAINILRTANFHGSGTGATAATVFDKTLQTAAAPTATTAVAGTQSVVPSGTVPKYQSVVTLNYVSTLTITEWALFNQATLSATTGTPLTAATATLATATATPYTASSTTVQGQAQNVIFPGTTTVWGLILSNTTAALTIPAWYTVAADAAGSTPGATEAFTIKPVMWDHKVFTGIGVNNGDSIQFTYQLQINSGG